MHAKNQTINPAEATKFAELAQHWWDPKGPMKPLHQLNPVRLRYIKDRISAHYGSRTDLTALDVGCGAGLVSEPLTRMGFSVTGVDASPDVIAAASAHAALHQLPITYQAGEVATLKGQFDLITALEVVEHVSNVPAFLSALRDKLKPGGLLILSTLNRTMLSYLVGIIAAERILGLVPKGTHEWQKFITPAELSASLTELGFTVADQTGLLYAPLRREFFLHPTRLGVNYLVCATLPQ